MFEFQLHFLLDERKKLLAQVEEKWRCRENKNTSEDYSESESDEDDPFEEVEDCIIKVRLNFTVEL